MTEPILLYYDFPRSTHRTMMARRRKLLRTASIWDERITRLDLCLVHSPHISTKELLQIGARTMFVQAMLYLDDANADLRHRFLLDLRRQYREWMSLPESFRARAGNPFRLWEAILANEEEGEQSYGAA